MKKILFLLMFTATIAKAQWYAVPDTNFRNALISQGFGGCMNAAHDSIQSGCFVSTDAAVDFSNQNIYSMDGIQALDSLHVLYCNNNHLTSLPVFPSRLIVLDCQHNQLGSLNNLPNNLVVLNCSYNQISFIPSLPNTINLLVINHNNLTQLPNIFPPQLSTLSCKNNLLTSVQNISMPDFVCDSNYISSLPDTIFSYSLSCSHNNLSTLPSVTENLNALDCSYNNITELPHYSTNLMYLYCNNNPISCMYPMSPFLNHININNTNITCVPSYPMYLDTNSSYPFTNIYNYPLCEFGNINGCETCSSHPNFTLVADTTTPHNYFAINQSTGAGNLQYVWYWGDNSEADTIANPTHIYSAPGYYNICVTVTDSSGCGNTFCDSSTYITKSNNAIISVTVINATTGIHQLKNKDAVSLSPNPTNSSFQILNTQNIINISIKNILGKEIFQTNNINKSAVDIDIADYTAGVYFVELQSDNGIITKKIVKQ